MKKKILSATLVAALLASTALFGCSSDGDKKDENKNEGSAKTKITIGIWPNSDDASGVANFEGYQATFNKQYPDVELVPASYKYATDTFLPLVEAGKCPTIFETWFTEPQKLIRNNLVKDITEVLKAKGWYDMIGDSVMDLISKDGKVYGVPRDGYVLGVMCNVELFEEAGLVDGDGVPVFPKTWDELAETAKKIKDKTGAAGLCLLAQDNAGGWHWSNIAWCFGANLVTDNGDGTYTSELNSKEAVAAMQYVKDLKWKYDVLTDDPTAENWGTGFTQLGTGACAMYIAANDAVDQPTKNNGLATDKLAMCAIPAGPNGDQYGLTGGTPYMFSKNATDEEVSAALDFLTVIGRGPVMTEESIEGMKTGAANNVADGVPVIKGFSSWKSPERDKAEAEVIAEFKNVDDKMFANYFATPKIRSEEPGKTQKMYEELTKVLQAVVTDENADVQALLDVADDNYQKILDDPDIN